VEEVITKIKELPNNTSLISEASRESFVEEEVACAN
jgi:hypothetical protein